MVSTMKKKLIAGNWKMNGGLAANQALLQALLQEVGAPACDVAVAVPAAYLAQGQAMLQGSPISLAAQDVSQHETGAYTGEVSASMLGDFGVRYAIVGHSERRQYHGETSEIVARKFVAAKAAGLVPVLCIGETLEEREAGQTEARLTEQLDAVFDAAGPQALDGAIVAYEPVWAIGTGKTASPAQAQEVHAFIRGQAAKRDANMAGSLPILYGGSVKADNAGELFAQPDVDGGLVGGASLLADEFNGIIAAAVASRN